MILFIFTSKQTHYSKIYGNSLFRSSRQSNLTIFYFNINKKSKVYCIAYFPVCMQLN